MYRASVVASRATHEHSRSQFKLGTDQRPAGLSISFFKLSRAGFE
jgi:hypothetical protein